jgi:hypothetical protein
MDRVAAARQQLPGIEFPEVKATHAHSSPGSSASHGPSPIASAPIRVGVAQLVTFTPLCDVDAMSFTASRSLVIQVFVP